MREKEKELHSYQLRKRTDRSFMDSLWTGVRCKCGRLAIIDLEESVLDKRRGFVDNGVYEVSIYSQVQTLLGV